MPFNILRIFDFIYAKEYIVIQMKIDEDAYKDNVLDIRMSSIVLKVEAINKSVAIEKFKIATQKIRAIKKLEIECYELDKIPRISIM
ncbi:MAG TPA: hypothetical protein PLC61_00385 [Chitinophagales bacterium]|nr:hypothetical protein [Chitinophagales bacterium]MCB9075935.1 hypothetical protein [Chitinophagales bacterium]HMU97274.1 hypothetical protein [Chitinophagales bacterium]HMV02855.1 hypothetical protein [Chitinophagales bacterium]HMW94689.1 hypothetical protein [Chitinophagales bacterium]